VAPLIPPSPGGVLLTSRAHFALPGLQAVTLDTLSPQEAVALLATIAGMPPAQTGAAAAPLRDIAELCGYLPLALRAAASVLAEIPDLSPAAYARELAGARARLELTGPKAEGVELSVEASFTASYDRLPPETQAVFGALAVFPASFDAAAAEAVCADQGHRQLSDLVRRSLVSYIPPSSVGRGAGGEGEGRYRLDSLARAYADSRLAPTARAEVARRHARHYAGVIRTANELYLQGREGVRAGLALFDQEWPNFQAGQAWAATRCADSDEAAQLCIDFAGPGAILDLRLHPRDGIRWFGAGLEAARRLKDLRAEGAHLSNLGLAYAGLGDMGTSIGYFEKALALGREIGDRGAEAGALGNLGFAYAYQGETRRAIAFYEQSLAIAREIGDRQGEGTILGNLGLAYVNLGETSKAVDYYEKALAMAREFGDVRREGATLGNLGLALINLGESDKAMEYNERFLAIAREIGDPRGEGNALWNLSLTLEAEGDPVQALAYAELALPILEQTESPYAERVRKQLEGWKVLLTKPPAKAKAPSAKPPSKGKKGARR